MAATARLSLPQFVPGSIRRSQKWSRSRSHPARAANERPEKLPFPMPTSLNAPPSSSLPPPFRPPPPPPWPRAVSLDVEFSHYQEEQPEGDDDDEENRTKAVVLRVPADVAVVGDEGEVLLRALVAPPTPWPPRPQVRRRRPCSSYRWVGGVPREETESLGLDLDLVSRELARLLSGGCLLVGHGVRGDLAALGFEVFSSSSSSSSPAPPPLSIPASRIRDTSTSPELLKRRKSGHKKSSSTKLDELFARAFGLELRAKADIPPPPISSSSSSSASRHDPVADAAAAMALYLTLIKGTLDDAASGAKELEEMETERLLQEFRARRDEESRKMNE